MVIVPACGPCNQGFGQDEEYFRTVLVAMIGQGRHPEVDALLSGKVKRSLDRNNSLCTALTRGFEFYPQFTSLGLFSGWEMRSELDLARFNRCVEKTVRGLFYLKSQRLLAAGIAVRVFPGNGFWQIQGFQNLLAAMEDWASVGDNVFQCRCVRDSGTPDMTAWLFVYYKAVGIFAWTQGAGGVGKSGE